MKRFALLLLLMGAIGLVVAFDRVMLALPGYLFEKVFPAAKRAGGKAGSKAAHGSNSLVAALGSMIKKRKVVVVLTAHAVRDFSGMEGAGSEVDAALIRARARREVPVQNLATGRVEITSQNHGYAINNDTNTTYWTWCAVTIGSAAPLTPEQSAQTPVWLATLPDDGPTGGFFREKRPIPW